MIFDGQESVLLWVCNSIGSFCHVSDLLVYILYDEPLLCNPHGLQDIDWNVIGILI